MKTAKSYKILILLVAFVLSMVAWIGFVMPKPVSASNDEIKLSDYFSGLYNNAEFKNGNIVFSVREIDNDTELKFKNQLVIDDLGLEFTGEFSKIASLKMIVESKAYSVNGNKQADGKYLTTIANEILLIENNSLADGDNLSVKLSVKEGFLNYNVNAQGEEKLDDKSLKLGARDKYLGTISFEIELAGDNQSANFELVSVNQKASDTSASNPYKQTFAMTDGKLDKYAYPRIVLGDNLFQADASKGELLTVQAGARYSLSTTAVALFNKEYTSSSLYVTTENVDGANGVDGDGHVATSDSSSKMVVFNLNSSKKEDTMAFGITSHNFVADANNPTEDGLFEIYEVKVVGDTKTAPEYVQDEDSLKGYVHALNELIIEDYGVNDGVHSIRLGETITLPSLKDLVYDDNTSYENLSYTVYYNTPTTQNGSSSSMKLKIEEAGNYEFFVVFKDKEGNSMEKDDFYKANEEDAGKLDDGKYYHSTAISEGMATSYGYVFRFRVEDDAPIFIEANEEQADGYLNIRYTASDFQIKSSKDNVEYKLYFNASQTINVNRDTDLSNWKQIADIDTVNNKDFTAGNGFTKEQLEEINYNGKVIFTPTAKGTYVIECTITSGSVVGREDRAIAVIRVNQEPVAVEYDNHWLENNVWSVVFLSIGSLCLIGIVVLLFVKPKEEADE